MKDPNVERENNRQRLEKIADMEADIKKHGEVMDEAIRSGYSSPESGRDSGSGSGSSSGGGMLALIVIIVIVLALLSQGG